MEKLLFGTKTHARKTKNKRKFFHSFSSPIYIQANSNIWGGPETMRVAADPRCGADLLSFTRKALRPSPLTHLVKLSCHSKTSTGLEIVSNRKSFIRFFSLVLRGW